MRHLGFTAGFVATCALVAPIAWHHLDASVEHDGRHVRPLQRSFQAGAAKVTIDVDHNLVEVGDTVTATLRAYAASPGPVKVDLAVYYTNDQWGGRVSSPPRAIDLEHLTLAAAPDGGTPVATRIKLTGTGKVNTFRIFAMPHGHKLDIWNDGMDGTDDGHPTGATDLPEVAAVPVLGWAGNDFAIAIQPEGPVIANKPVTVAVRVKNTTGHAIKRPFIELGSEVALSGVTTSDDVQIAEANADASGGDGTEPPLAAGATLVDRFTVTPTRADAKEVTLIATAFVWPDDIGTIDSGAMDAKTLAIAHPGAQVAAQ